MNDDKKLEIKSLIDGRWEEDKGTLCDDVMMKFIFGPLGYNEHYTIDSIVAIWDELYLEKNPIPEPEPVEEPIVE